MCLREPVSLLGKIELLHISVFSRVQLWTQYEIQPRMIKQDFSHVLSYISFLQYSTKYCYTHKIQRQKKRKFCPKMRWFHLNHLIYPTQWGFFVCVVFLLPFTLLPVFHSSLLFNSSYMPYSLDIFEANRFSSLLKSNAGSERKHAFLQTFSWFASTLSYNVYSKRS